LGAKGFAAKKKVYVVSDLKTTSEVTAFANWNRASIDKRQEEMAKRAKAIWRFA